MPSGKSRWFGGVDSGLKRSRNAALFTAQSRDIVAFSDAGDSNDLGSVALLAPDEYRRFLKETLHAA